MRLKLKLVANWSPIKSSTWLTTILSQHLTAQLLNIAPLLTTIRDSNAVLAHLCQSCSQSETPSYLKRMRDWRSISPIPDFDIKLKPRSKIAINPTALPPGIPFDESLRWIITLQTNNLNRMPTSCPRYRISMWHVKCNTRSVLAIVGRN